MFTCFNSSFFSRTESLQVITFVVECLNDYKFITLPTLFALINAKAEPNINLNIYISTLTCEFCISCKMLQIVKKYNNNSRVFTNIKKNLKF